MGVTNRWAAPSGIQTNFHPFIKSHFFSFSQPGHHTGRVESPRIFPYHCYFFSDLWEILVPGVIEVLLTFVIGETLTVVIAAVLDVLVDAIFTGFTTLRGRAILFLTAAFILAGFLSTGFFFGIPIIFSLMLRGSFAPTARIIPSLCSCCAN